MAIGKIFEQAAETPAKTAVVFNGVSHSYAEFASRIDAARDYLSQCDLPPGSVAILCVDSLLDAWTLGIALRSLGVTTVAARSVAEAASLGLRNVSGIVTMEQARSQGLAGAAADSPWRLLRVPASIRTAATSGRTASLGESVITPGGHIMLTSGTTGQYKKVLRDPVAEARAALKHGNLYGIGASSIVYVMNFGLWTAGGYRWPLITWTQGGTVIIHQRADLYRPLTEHAVTQIFATPAMLPGLMQAPAGIVLRNDEIRLFVTGGALSNRLLEATKQRLTRRVYSLLASTEASVIGMTLLEQPEDLLWHRVDPSRDVQVVDAAGKVLAPGKEGWVRSRVLDGITSYVDDDATTRAFFRDGYFYPGDMGVFGHDGRLALVGRSADVINVLGDKIATGPMERALQDRLGADGVCILTLDEVGAEEAVYVVVQSARAIEQAELAAAAQADLARIGGVPMHFCLVKDLPRNEMGKIQRLVLKKELKAMLEASAGSTHPGAKG